jgi:hypothetical protein
LMRWGWRHLGFPMFFKPIVLNERKQLLEDPGSYLNYLRTGRRRCERYRFKMPQSLIPLGLDRGDIKNEDG